MSTRSRIAIKQNDGTYKSIYCHSDGYLEHNGYILYNYYQDPIKVNLLISLGDLSSLGQYVYPDTSKKHDFNFPQKNVTVAYHRDRLEDLHFSVNTTLDELKEMVANSDQEYLYLFEDGKWKYAKIFFHNFPNGWATTIILLCVFGGIQLFCLGLIGEYVGQVFQEVKARPRYIKDVELK